MIRKRIGVIVALAACLMTTAFSIGAQAQEVGPGVTAQTKKEEKAEVKTESGIAINRLQAAQDTDKVIVVVGTGMDSANVNVAYFKKDETGSWTEDFYVSGFCGAKGMAVDKREGDRRTPVGAYGFTKAFGIKADPGSILPYKKLDRYDYWVDDSNSKYYNQMVSAKTTPITWKSAEHLVKVDPCYNYSIALNYNEACVPGKGSAIFIHGIDPNRASTGGCIAIPEARMIELVQQVDAKTRIVIVSDASKLEYIPEAS